MLIPFSFYRFRTYSCKVSLIIVDEAFVDAWTSLFWGFCTFADYGFIIWQFEPFGLLNIRLDPLLAFWELGSPIWLKNWIITCYIRVDRFRTFTRYGVARWDFLMLLCKKGVLVWKWLFWHILIILWDNRTWINLIKDDQVSNVIIVLEKD